MTRYFNEWEEQEFMLILLLARLGAADNDNLEAISSGLGIDWGDLMTIVDRMSKSNEVEYRAVMEELGYGEEA